MMRIAIFNIGLFILVILLAVGCGGGVSETPQATATPPPTATAAPALPTSATEATPLPTLGPGVFTDALTKAKSANSYRLELQMSGSGIFNPMTALATPEPNSTPVPVDQLFPVISMNGEVNGKDSHLTVKGVMSAFLGADPNKGMEVTTVTDNAYVHGPVAMLGAPEDKWYQVPAGQAETVKPPVAPGSIFDAFAQTGLNPNDFKPAGTESLDGQNCNVFVGDKDVTLKTFQELNKSDPSGQTAAFDIDTADFRFWVCPDGYLHQSRLAVNGHQKDKPDQKGQYMLVVHLWDPNVTIPIQPPQGAVPLEKSPFQLPGETPSGSVTPTP